MSPSSHLVLEHGVQLVSIDLELSRDYRRHPRRPVDPGIALIAGEPENLRHRLGPVDQLALHLLQAEPTLLGLEHFVCRARLHEGHAAGRDRLTLLAQGVAHRAERRVGHRLQRPAIIPRLLARGRSLLRLVGVASPRGLGPRGVPGAVRLALDPACLLGPAHRRLAHTELARELPIAGHAHPYKCSEVKS